MRRLLGLAVLAALAVAPPAAASTIVYACGPNICSISPDGGKPKRLTSDGKFGAAFYEQPQLTADGKRMVFLRQGQAWVADRRARGRRPVTQEPGRTALELVLEPGRNRAILLSALVAGNQTAEPQRCRFSLTRRTAACEPLPPAPFSYFGAGPAGALSAVDSERTRLCVVGPEGCARALVQLRPPRTFFMRTVVSPDGRLIAAGVDAGEDTRIALFDARTGRHVRDATRGHTDYPPAWSPDSRRLVFRRDLQDEGVLRGSICTVSARGGRVRCLARRVTDVGAPSWGG